VLLRCRKYLLLSSNQEFSGKLIRHQPVLLKGNGKIIVGENVEIGVVSSACFHNSYGYIEARKTNSKIVFGDNVKINNNVLVVADQSEIIIEENVIIGINCQIFNSDFHNLHPSQRNSINFKSEAIRIHKNVFLGNNVIILKAVTIGENSIIGAGSVVATSIPANVVAAGNPAKVLKVL